MLKLVGEALVDVHGQHDAQYLLKPANQLFVIDEFGGCSELRAQFGQLFGQRQELLRQQKELTASRTLRKQQLDLYEFQAKEIDDAQPVAGEQDELQARHRVLSNLEKIKKEASAAYGALYEEEGAATGRVKTVLGALLALAELDEALMPLATQLRDAAAGLEDTAFSLRRYVDRLELDPQELAEIADRLNLVNRLVSKYGGAMGTLEEVLAYRQQIGGQVDTLRKQDVDFSALGEQIAKLEAELQRVGGTLTKARLKAAEALGPKIHSQLADLGMKEARFAVEFQPLQVLPDKAVAKTRTAAGARPAAASDFAALVPDDFSTASGLETVEFMIAPNPGQPARPLRRIASGGELSRIMLALKSILAQADRVSVLVFDEIDANVGGRMGTIIGEKLRALARIHQVLCITHLPQIASFGDRHVTIRKATTKGESFTTVTVLEGEARVQELAEMIAGKDATATSLAQARELLEIAEKSGRRMAKAKK